MGNMSRLLCFMDIMRNSCVENGDREKVLALRIANGLKVLAYCDEFERRDLQKRLLTLCARKSCCSLLRLKRKVMKKNCGRGLECIRMEMN